MKKSDQQEALISVPVLLIAALFFLPQVFPVLFAGMELLLAAPVVVLFQTATSDEQVAFRLLKGLLIAAVGAAFVGQVGLFAFSLAMLPLGCSLHYSLRRKQSPAAAGGIGLAALGLTWLVFWSLAGMAKGGNPYHSLLADIDSSLAQLTELYRSSKQLPADMLYHVELTSAALRRILPKILPGLLAGTAILTVWLNMMASSFLLRKMQQQPVWPAFSCWQLPDYLIWLLIAAGVLSLVGPGTLKDAGYCLGIAVGLIYFLQGAAILSHLLHRWHLPVLARFVCYFLATVQSYGVLLLAVVGAADTWADFRKLAQQQKPAD